MNNKKQELVELEELLSKVPKDSGDPDDVIASHIFLNLIKIPSEKHPHAEKRNSKEKNKEVDR